ncbi:O-methyltransferase [Paenibacillus sp. 2RAB27]|uniref:O-methyltransferase n=1 Tax=Paenibacillus sp. 2RAB27 TaxID=3232991 RepID=UPI003F9EA701
MIKTKFMENNLENSVVTQILIEANDIGFNLSCDSHTGSLLMTLAASKRNGRFLELGTGVGSSTAYILAGMDSKSSLITVEFDEKLQDIAKKYLSVDERVQFYLGDAGEYITKTYDQRFDIIFADTYPGKYTYLNETLELLNIGGLYVIDDLLPVDEDDDDPKMEELVRSLENRLDLIITKLNWSTGLIIATKISN